MAFVTSHYFHVDDRHNPFHNAQKSVFDYQYLLSKILTNRLLNLEIWVVCTVCKTHLKAGVRRTFYGVTDSDCIARRSATSFNPNLKILFFILFLSGLLID